MPKRAPIKSSNVGRLNEFLRVHKEARRRGIIASPFEPASSRVSLYQTLKELKLIGAVSRHSLGNQGRIALTRYGKLMNNHVLAINPTFRRVHRTRAEKIAALIVLLHPGVQRAKLKRGDSLTSVLPRDRNGFARDARSLLRYGLVDREFNPTPLGELAILRSGRSLIDPTKPIEAWHDLTPMQKNRYYQSIVAGLLEEMRVKERRPRVRMPSKDELEELTRLGKIEERLLHEMFTSLEANVSSEAVFAGNDSFYRFMLEAGKEMKHRLS